MLNIFNNPAMTAMKVALDGLGLREQLIAHNIANIDTPRYQAVTAEFEGQLARAIGSVRDKVPKHLAITHSKHVDLPGQSSPTSLDPTVTQRAASSTRLDGNNVDLDLEMTQLAETNLRYQATTQLISKRLSLLRMLAGRR